MGRTRVSVRTLFACAIGIGIAGCKGDTGPAGPAGPAGPPGTSGGTASTSARLYAKIVSATIPNGGAQGGAPTLTYRLFRDAAYTQDAGTCAGGGSTGYAAFTPNFTAAKLVDDPSTPGTKTWQSYINRLIGTVKVATTEGGRGTVAGTLKDNGDGSCTYTYKSDLSQKAAPSTTAAVTEAYDPAAATRLGMQNNGNTLDATSPAFDGWADVQPGGAQLQAGNARAIVSTQACNQCHHDLAHHGAKRLSTEYCVTCHNPGTPDPNATSVGSTTLSFGVMVHKIHQGGNLPSVTGINVNGVPIPGAPTNGTIVINGTDYTFVGFPQDTGNCTVCHDVTTGTGSDYWKNQPSIEACSACHDRVDFSASLPGTGGTPPKAGFIAHPAGAVQDGQCAQCHAEGKIVAVTSTHPLAVPSAAQQKASLKIVSVTNGAPGSKPTVTFAVTNPAAGNANFDLATDPLWNAGGNSRLFLDLGWTVKPGVDWTNTGSGAVTGFGAAVATGSPAPGQPVQIDLLAGLKATPATVSKNADGTYTATSSVSIPSNAVGSGVAVLEGHPGTSGTGGTSFPVTTATAFFTVTGGAATPRRDVVDIQKCDKCHGMLNLHGNNRNDNIQACVVCHNSEATDVTQRSGTGIDNKAEQSILFAVLIHGIHAGATDPATTGIVVYPFTGKAGGAGPGTPSDFRDVQFPEGNSVGRCDKCHADSNPFPSADFGLVNAVTITTNDSADQATYLRTTRIAAICSSCHQGADAAAHMSLNGGAGIAPVGTTPISGSGLTQAQIDAATGNGTETCAICHGSGRAFDPVQFHLH